MNDSRKDNNDNLWPRRTPQRDDDGMKLWGVFLFGFIGATITTLAVGQLHQSVRWFHGQLSRSQPRRGSTGSSYRSTFSEEWKRYYHRMQEENQEECQRVERIRRMQNIFNRERHKYKRSYEAWRDYGPGTYHQHYQHDDWYWQSDFSYKAGGENSYSRSTPKESVNYTLSHHYSVLGLDRFRTEPYTDAEIKTAFRAKAKEYHPDQNPKNKDAAEAKFKEVMASYEAIQQERKQRIL